MLRLIFIFGMYLSLSTACLAGVNSGIIHFHGAVVIGGCSTNTDVMNQKVSFTCEQQQQGKRSFSTTLPIQNVFGSHSYGGSYLKTSIRRVNHTNNLKLLTLNFD
ncbi:TPA: hypothetical protein ACF3I9_004485 [Klebsiella aerogenes]